jgi:Family of unknown function (DUF5678)
MGNTQDHEKILAGRQSVCEEGGAMGNELARKRLPSRKIKPMKPAALRRPKTGMLVSRYPVPPRELAGKWVAWSNYRIVASGDTFADVMDQIAVAQVKNASYERLPSLNSNDAHRP